MHEYNDRSRAPPQPHPGSATPTSPTSHARDQPVTAERTALACRSSRQSAARPPLLPPSNIFSSCSPVSEPYLMAPKIDPKDPAVARLVDLFATISLTGQKAIDTIRNPNLCSSLENVIEKEGLSTKGLDAKGGTLVVSAVTLGINLPEEKRSYVVRRILDGSLKTTDQVSGACSWMRMMSSIGPLLISISLLSASPRTAACKYIEPLSGEVDQSEFDRECGVGKWHGVKLLRGNRGISMMSDIKLKACIRAAALSLDLAHGMQSSNLITQMLPVASLQSVTIDHHLMRSNLLSWLVRRDGDPRAMQATCGVVCFRTQSRTRGRRLGQDASGHGRSPRRSCSTMGKCAGHQGGGRANP